MGCKNSKAANNNVLLAPSSLPGGGTHGARHGRPCISVLVEEEKWEDIFHRARSEPQDFGQVIEIDILGLTGLKWKCLPLHALCSRTATPLQILHCALRAFPPAARIQDQDGALPLHYACFDADHPARFVTAVLTEYPEGARVRNSVGYLPLHLACWIGSAAATVKGLLAVYPQAVRERDYGGELPLHAACDGHAAAEVVALLLERDPQSVYVTNKKGLTPLDFAARKKKVDFAVLEVLEKVRATTAPPTPKAPTPTARELLFPPALAKVASMSSITSALHQKRMLCCDCPKYDAVGDLKSPSTKRRETMTIGTVSIQELTSIRASKSTLATANIFATKVERVPSPQHSIQQPLTAQPRTPPPTTTTPPRHSTDHRDAHHTARHHPLPPPPRQPPLPPPQRQPPLPHAHTPVPMHGPTSSLPPPSPSVPYSLGHKSSLPVSRLSQEMPLRRYSSLKKKPPSVQQVGSSVRRRQPQQYSNVPLK
eukprot:CAMPEP_0194308552 /NCGR_PEP_ID=MMETSP0171-20130528/5512_1 /TAXON_ID=218684 /ORGANISM="Corethron pennatum, Strain L29A3" /LENGTH=482 /DNA_ID=CAMNT_0039061245 /DNA_START=207 /DNA_END=1655 /DNA_ORIENTATION=+